MSEPDVVYYLEKGFYHGAPEDIIPLVKEKPDGNHYQYIGFKNPGHYHVSIWKRYDMGGKAMELPGEIASEAYRKSTVCQLKNALGIREAKHAET